MENFTLKKSLGKGVIGTVCDLLASETGLSKSKIKDAMNKGALWVGKEKGWRRGGLRRLRKATSMLNEGMRIEFHYDQKLLSLKPPQARLLEDLREYSVWHKPAGLMAQGTIYGDHCSLLRQVEIYFGNAREYFLVHRLDREATGLMLIAHTKKAAAKLSEIFRNNLITKKYRVEVLGNLAEKCIKGTINLPIDNKAALTHYEVESYYPASDTSIIDVSIKTGRLHQIRRHFDMVGFPVIGDPKYGTGNKNKDNGMKLVAYSLSFICPFRNREVEFSIEPDK
ncbi:MAG: RluA family pseudouridine synthase [Dissulfurispiraceae bacterium]